ncbi:MAG: phosphatidate cytidylyltransferase [Ponticaulis sp.]|nr:phosphatidate cytidylyltransferase [Ponticaulis sp.]|tara:strand:- start:54481 stop:55314 length:834 start_codon:yes stop_codon:yes gene_type:complete
MMVGIKGAPDQLSLRVISALVMIPAGLGVVWAGGAVLLLAGLVCGAVMWSEFFTVTTKQKFNAVSVILAGLMGVGIFALTWQDQLAGLIFAGCLAVAAVCLLVTKTPKLAWLLGGMLAISVAVSSLILLRGTSADRLILTFIVMTGVWVTDIAAYFAGRGFGGPQLSPRGSPNKTWSGAAGAMICTALVGAFVAGLVGGPILNWVLFMAAVSIVGQAGDLTQSLWKRRFGVKDSGSIIPGHGGVLDRLDSFSSVLIILGLILYFSPRFPVLYLGMGA